MKEVAVSLYTLIVRMYNVFKCNLQNRKFMVLIEDDIHFIHAKYHSKSSIISTIWHMCTAVVDVHESGGIVRGCQKVSRQCTSDYGGWQSLSLSRGYRHPTPSQFCIC